MEGPLGSIKITHVNSGFLVNIVKENDNLIDLTL